MKSKVYGGTTKYFPTKVSSKTSDSLRTSTSSRYYAEPAHHKGYRSRLLRVNEEEGFESHFGGDIIWRNRLQTTTRSIEKSSISVKKDSQRPSKKIVTEFTKIETEYDMKKPTTKTMSKNYLN